MTAIASPNFGTRSVHINQALTQFSLGYHPTGMIAEQVCPVLSVSHETDLYWKWDKGQAFRVERSDGYGTLRADGAPAKVGNYGATQDSYTAYEFAKATKITDRERANADRVLALEQSKIRRSQDEVLLDYEIRVASMFLATANNTGNTTLSGTSQWNNASFSSQPTNTFSTIKKNIDDGVESVRQNTGGYVANTIIIPRAVAVVMSRDIGLTDYVKYTHTDLLVAGLLPPTLWGMKVIIPTAVYQTAVEGEAFSGSDVWGKSVWLGYIDPNPGPDSLTYALTLRSRPWRVKTWREEKEDSTYYEAGFVQAEKLVAADCGYLIKNAIA